MLLNKNNYNKKNKHCSLVQRTIQSMVIMLVMMISSAVSATSLTNVSYNTLQNDEIRLLFEMSGAMAEQADIQTNVSPARIDITFYIDDFSPEFSSTLIEHAGVNNITVQKLAGKIVASIHLNKLSVFDIEERDDSFAITLNKNIQQQPISAANTVGDQFINTISALDFRVGADNEAQVLIELEDSMVAVDVSDKLGKLYVEFHNTEIPEDLLYTLDVTDFGTLVTNIETFREGRNSRIVIETSEPFSVEHSQLDEEFSLVISKKEGQANYLDELGDFNGRPIALDFQDIAVRTALQIIADYNGFNLVTSDTVTGSLTLRLDGVPWDQALDLILKVKGLDKRMEGNILMIAPSDELAAREARDLEALRQVEELAPLYSEYVQVNYAKASEFANLVKTDDNSILSDRGSVSVDERTNTLLIRDTAKSIEDIKRMVSVLDVPVRQVVIESRMVTVKDNINEELGIRWGITDTDGEYSTSGSLEGTSNAANGIVPSLAERLNVNLPASAAASSIAFQVARLADGTILDLELSAMEKENKGEIIASPRITTSNQKEAYIEQGVEIPYQEAASSGATSTQFRKAVLSLKVTPQITPDDRIILDLVVTQDSVSDVQSGQAPAIDTQRIGTQVLVNNGETIVLGGIYQQSIVNSVSKVPVLGDIPYFGWMFRNSANFNEKKELLIFVTPRIVTERF